MYAAESIAPSARAMPCRCGPSQARMFNVGHSRFLQVDPIGYDDQINLYGYVAGDPMNLTDPAGTCGYRYDDGSCRVKVDPKTGQEGIAAGRELEARLNANDKLVKGLDSKGRYEVKDSSGRLIGEYTGKQLQKSWNTQKFSVTSKDFGNGGYGRTIPGRTDLQPRAVKSYSEGAIGLGKSAIQGIDTLIFHEFGHAFGPGLGAAIQNPGTANVPNAIAEKAASAQGRAILNSIKGTFICELPGPYGC